ncbi:DUF3224 domain-containing protein [Acidovorax sp. NPDC077664]|uniref:DUF3224 domain-containing protein n=1 Tax=Acidovorax sp. NPDC077664 TaxID=3390544 RepID=UPI003D0874C6
MATSTHGFLGVTHCHLGKRRHPGRTITFFFQAAIMISNTANGSFDVQITPQPLSDVAASSGLARMSIDKRFHGALDATSTGEMLAFRTATPGSAGYVAMETVRGSLQGRSGSFVLQHSSTMARGEPAQSITVVPDSGTDALTGLSGRMTIDVAADGAHAYRFEFSWPETAA